MMPRDFAFWLQGFFELTEPKQITEKQVAIIRQHLSLVFEHAIPEAAHPPVEDSVAGPMSEDAPSTAKIPVDLAKLLRDLDTGTGRRGGPGSSTLLC